MSQVKVTFPEMTRSQRRCLAASRRFNLVVGGEKSGKTTLGIEVLLSRGAMVSKRPVAWFAATVEDMIAVRRRVIQIIEPLVKRRASSRRLELRSGGAIDFYALEDGPQESFEAYGLVVVDDARKIAGLLDFWEDVLRPIMLQSGGEAWLLSGAYGQRNDFYHLWLLAQSDADWSRSVITSFENPHVAAEFRPNAELSGSDEYRQRFMGEFLKAAYSATDYRKLINLPTLHPAQHRMLQESRRYNVAVCGRRFGKTFLSAEVLVDGPRKKGALHGYPVALYAPTYSIMLESWRVLCALLAPITSKKSEQNKRIDLLSGGSIELWSLDDPDAGRGRKYATIVIDEAAMVRRLEEAFTQNIQPLLLDYRGEAWFLSTPKGDNYFKRMFDMGNPANPSRHLDWQSWQIPTWENPYISRADIEDMQRSMPRLAFLQEIEAQFVTFAGTFIKSEHIHVGRAPSGLRLYQGVDLAISMKETADYTAIVTVGIEASGRVWIVDAERRRVGFRDALDFIKSKAARWKPDQIGVEVVQYQAAAVEELLRSTDLPVRKIRPDKDKLTRAQALITRYENGLVWHNDILPVEFTNEVLSFGPDCEHDDFVDAAVYAFAMASGYGRASIFIAGEEAAKSKEAARMKALQSYSPGLHMAIQDVEQLSGDVCGRCISFENGRCSERDGLRVREADHGCPMFIAA